MRYALFALGILLVLMLAIVAVGWALPVAHVAMRSVHLNAPPDSVFALVSTPEGYPAWRKDVKKVDVMTEKGVTRFREEGKNGTILYEVGEKTPPRRFVTIIADKSLPFGGRWIYEVTPAANGSELRITEEGEVYNPIFRFVSRYVMGQTATIDAYLAQVRARFGS